MMNERIKQLETKAWGQVPRTNGLVRTEDFNQKFAELIVRECHNYFYDDDVLFNGVDGLLAHFGVEE